MPYVTPFAEQIGAAPFMMGVIASAYGITQIIIRFPLGLFADRLGKLKIFAQIGMVLSGAGGLLVFFLPSEPTLLVARALAGVTASNWVTLTVLGSRFYPPSESVKAAGFMSVANGLGRMSALFLGGLVGQYLGVSYAFLFAGAVGFLALLVSFGLKEPEITRKASPSFKALFGALREPQLLICSVLAILLQYLMFSTMYGFTPVLATRLNASPFALGALGALSTLPAVIFPTYVHIIIKKLGANTPLICAFIILGISTFYLPFATNIYALIATQVLGGIGLAIAMTTLFGLCIKNITPEFRATAMGFFQAVYGIGIFAGPFFTGWITENQNIEAAFMFASALTIVGIVITAFLANRGYMNK